MCEGGAWRDRNSAEGIPDCQVFAIVVVVLLGFSWFLVGFHVFDWFLVGFHNFARPCASPTARTGACASGLGFVIVHLLGKVPGARGAKVRPSFFPPWPQFSPFLELIFHFNLLVLFMEQMLDEGHSERNLILISGSPCLTSPPTPRNGRVFCSGNSNYQNISGPQIQNKLVCCNSSALSVPYVPGKLIV